MKTTFKCIILAFIALLFTGCPGLDAYSSYFFRMHNDSNTDVYIHLKYAHLESYSDTISISSQSIYGHIKVNDYKGIAFNLFPHQDSVYIFILANIYPTYNEYKILQRYRLSREELKQLNYDIHYPPDERMKDIIMYPPYQEQ